MFLVRADFLFSWLGGFLGDKGFWFQGQYLLQLQMEVQTRRIVPLGMADHLCPLLQQTSWDKQGVGCGVWEGISLPSWPSGGADQKGDGAQVGRGNLPHQLVSVGIPAGAGIWEGVSPVSLVTEDLLGDRQAVECGRILSLLIWTGWRSRQKAT